MSNTKNGLYQLATRNTTIRINWEFSDSPYTWWVASYLVWDWRQVAGRINQPNGLLGTKWRWRICYKKGYKKFIKGIEWRKWWYQQPWRRQGKLIQKDKHPLWIKYQFKINQIIKSEGGEACRVLWAVTESWGCLDWTLESLG